MLSVTFVTSKQNASTPCAVGFTTKGGLQAPKGFLSAEDEKRLQDACAAKHIGEKAGACVCAYGTSNPMIALNLDGLTSASTEGAWLHAGGQLAAFCEAYKISDLVLGISGLTDQQVCALAMGAALRSWRFDTYKTKKSCLLEVLHVVADDVAACTQLWEKTYAPMACSTLWARDLVNKPSNDLTPTHFLGELKKLENLGVRVSALDAAQMKEKGMGALLGVAQGSIEPPFLVSLEWKGEGASDKDPIVFVGKGVTFDSGGLSLKPSGGMEEMKGDMGGAAVVTGTLRALAMMKAPLHAVAVVALVENMPSGSAQRPGDIVRSLSGKTIEVLNTDAEGRLILADALTYAQATYHPSVLVDVATLTGAARHALGPLFGALFATTDTLAKGMLKAGKEMDERLWRLPLDPGYAKAMEGSVSDLQNIAPPGFGAGTCTAADFLKVFVKEDCPWAHLDIASVDMLRKDTPLATKGGSAFGVRLLCRWALAQKQ